MSDGHWRWLAGLVVALLFVGAVAGQAVRVHSETGQWTLSSAASSVSPPYTVTYEGRRYERGDLVELPSDPVARGRSENGSLVHKPAGDEDLRETTVIYVSRKDHTWAYSLVGGP